MKVLNFTVKQLETLKELNLNLATGAKNSGGMDESQDGKLAALIERDLSGNKSCIHIPVAGHKIQQVRVELKNPSRPERRNARCTPSLSTQ